ncbi:riboflavin kinase [Coemansia reversa NRRL 1564]|uniref:Riboflavin kinase n=1 Tax=Coemansia reversa (strain ATCC 12441 / NRRL 1564) TaxID=763665 RepID=A0A2G5B3G8_COERN|nr:riboflavin kinase [Coemansia reversa NRRL 1564]|eukprot:PIA13531.1 riboflavin kinase [Coemansia reversa NRRL 1564]
MVPTPESRSTEREDIVGPEIVTSPYPIFIEGTVVKGFGRGGKQLGIPTANLPEPVVEKALSDIPIGVYYGWAKVEKVVYPMVMSLGWNPYFRNEKRSGEVHIIHNFEDDFYGKNLKVVVLAYIRPEKDYTSIELLINDIKADINAAQQSLLRPAYALLH